MSISRNNPDDFDTRQYWLRSFVALNLNITQAFYTHPKILVVGLNGPVIGLSAALVAHADFIYCVRTTLLLRQPPPCPPPPLKGNPRLFPPPSEVPWVISHWPVVH